MSEALETTTRHELRTEMACGSRPGGDSAFEDSRLPQDQPDTEGSGVARPMPYTIL